MTDGSQRVSLQGGSQKAAGRALDFTVKKKKLEGEEKYKTSQQQSREKICINKKKIISNNSSVLTVSEKD